MRSLGIQQVSCHQAHMRYSNTCTPQPTFGIPTQADVTTTTGFQQHQFKLTQKACTVLEGCSNESTVECTCAHRHGTLFIHVHIAPLRRCLEGPFNIQGSTHEESINLHKASSVQAHTTLGKEHDTFCDRCAVFYALGSCRMYSISLPLQLRKMKGSRRVARCTVHAHARPCSISWSGWLTA